MAKKVHVLRQESIRTPDASMENLVTVIGPDGKADSQMDPHLDINVVLDVYKAMVKTRHFDLQLEKLQRQGRIGFHVGSLGEEAAIIGSAAALREQDWIFPCYREFGALLWRGFPLQRYVDNMFGNADDVVRGRQMPDHYTGRAYRYASVSSPIGTQITQATGVAWAAKIKKENLVVGVYFGDGATSSSDFHSAMNFAGVFRLPVVFLCRNNHWAISVPTEKQTASETVADKGVAYGMPSIRCDGNDALATYRVVRDAAQRASDGGGPTLIELLTYRLGGHSTSDDPRAYRKQDEVDEWQRTDPLVRLRKHLDTLKAWDDRKEDEFKQAIDAELRMCIERAEQKPKPSLASMFDDVYEERPWHLSDQLTEIEAGRRPIVHH